MKSPLALMKNFVAGYLANRGRRVTRYPLWQYLKDFKIDCVLDVGANVGQYAQEIRNLGYTGRIESFEPLSAALAQLEPLASADASWTVHSHALGNNNESMDINVSANSPSSSFLNMSSDLDTGSRDLSTVSTETVQIRTLDDVYADVVGDAQNVYLKIDTQGYESNVIEGGKDSLRSVAVVQMELSLVTNYDGELLIEEMIRRMRELEFTPWWLLDGFRNPKTQQLYQADAFFVRNGLRSA